VYALTVHRVVPKLDAVSSRKLHHMPLMVPLPALASGQSTVRLGGIRPPRWMRRDDSRRVFSSCSTSS